MKHIIKGKKENRKNRNRKILLRSRKKTYLGRKIYFRNIIPRNLQHFPSSW